MMQSAEVWAPIATAEVSIAIAEAFIGAVALASFLFGISRFLVTKEENITEYSTKVYSNR